MATWRTVASMRRGPWAVRLVSSSQITLRHGSPVEDPLRGIVGVGFGETVGVLLGGDLLPVPRGRKGP